MRPTVPAGDFQPVEILFFRFVMGLLALLLVCPRPLKGVSGQVYRICKPGQLQLEIKQEQGWKYKQNAIPEHPASGLVCPRPLKGVSGPQELTFAAAGLCGICLYYLLENIALTYTMASNVGVILSVGQTDDTYYSR